MKTARLIETVRTDRVAGIKASITRTSLYLRPDGKLLRRQESTDGEKGYTEEVYRYGPDGRAELVTVTFRDGEQEQLLWLGRYEYHDDEDYYFIVWESPTEEGYSECYDKDGNLMDDPGFLEPPKEVIEEHDDKGRLTRRHIKYFRDYLMDEVVEFETYEMSYNESGYLETETARHGIIGGERETFRDDYKYNAEGHWIEMYRRSGDGIKETTVSRKIYYY